MPSPLAGVAASSLSRWEREGGAQRRKGEGRRLLSSVLTFLPSFPRRRESRPATVSQAPQGQPVWIPACAGMTGWVGRVAALIFTSGTAPWRGFADRVPHILRHPGLVPGSTLRLGGRQEAQATPSRPGGPRTKSGVTAGVWLSAALTLTACAPPPHQGGIVSTNPCADAILAQIAPDRLAAVSHYSHDPAATSMPLALARRYPATAGTAEEVIARHPDLVVTDTFAPAATRAAYDRAGLKVLTLDSPATIAASEAQVMQIATAAGVPARGQAMVRAMQSAIPPATGAKPAALLYISGDLANGGGTLLDDLMTRAGLRNAAADYGLAFTGTLPIETLVAHPPALILSDGDGRTAELRRRILARSGAQVAEVRFPRHLMNCGGPTIVPALRRLWAIRAQLLS